MRGEALQQQGACYAAVVLPCRATCQMLISWWRSMGAAPPLGASAEGVHGRPQGAGGSHSSRARGAAIQKQYGAWCYR